MVTENYDAVRAKIEAAARRAGRDPAQITLVAVSKTKPLAMIEELIAHGARDFGENHAQELVEKQREHYGTDGVPGFADGVRWHFIGRLQRNKVKYVVGRAALIHSVDSLRLAEEIDKVAEKRGVETVPVLIEVNVAEEESKAGITAETLEETIRAAAALPHLSIRGLMTVAPIVERPEENRPVFAKLRALKDQINALGIPGVHLTELSMGMTGDYEAAVEEGATMVRVGSGIFGARIYPV